MGLATRLVKRIKLISPCYAGRLPCSSLHLYFDGYGEPAPHAKRF
jgi:hypothetical protein